MSPPTRTLDARPESYNRQEDTDIVRISLQNLTMMGDRTLATKRPKRSPCMCT